MAVKCPSRFASTWAQRMCHQFLQDFTTTISAQDLVARLPIACMQQCGTFAGGCLRGRTDGVDEPMQHNGLPKR